MEPRLEPKKDITTKQDAVFYIVRKVERIFATIQILCDLVPEQGEIAEALRKKTFPVLEAALALRAPRRIGIEDTILKLKDELATLEVYVSASALARRISEMNARIVREELFDLINYIDRHTDALSNDTPQVSTQLSMFGVESRPATQPTPPPLSLAGRDDPLVKRRIPEAPAAASTGEYQSKGHADIDLYKQLYGMPSVSAPIKKTQQPLRRTEPISEKVSARQKDRKLQILSLLQRKDRITVKDVAEVITDCSEKTLQRELLHMVETGVLKKEGERRWSTYSLA